MKVLFLLMGALWLTTGITAGPVSAGNLEAVDLSHYRWRHRLLLIFTPSADLPAYQTLLEQLHQERLEALDRDLLVFRLVNQGQSQVDEAKLSPAGAETLRKRLKIPENEFRVVLIGKDGSVKLSAGSADLADIFGLIDSMPMRQREMKERRN